MAKTKKTMTKLAIPQAGAEQAPRRRRRRRRRANHLLSQRLVTEVNQKKRQFLREVSGMLSDALGFEVRVTLVRPKIEMSVDMRRASRMTKAQARRQIADSMSLPVVPGKPKLDDKPQWVMPNGAAGPKLLEKMLNEPFERHRRRKAGKSQLDDDVGL